MGVPLTAIDVGPLLGRRTGIGHAVAALVDELARRDDVALRPYVVSLTSRRHRLDPDVRRLGLPAAAAHRLWAHTDLARPDRRLGGPDVVHGTNYVVPPARAARLVSVYDCWFLDHPDRVSPAVRRAGAVLTRSIGRGAVVHASSQATADAVAARFPGSRVHTVHLGALPLATPTESCPIAELDGRPFIVSIATLERRKNLARLVEAFGLIAGAHPDLRLVLAGGDGDARPDIDAAIDRLTPAHARRVLLTGYVDDRARSWLVHHAEVLAYPSLDEGFGFPLLDAMQAGTPIVAAATGSIPEVVGDAAELVQPTDVDALAAALEAVVDSGSRRHRLVRAGTERVGEFTWGRCADRMVELYRELAA